MKLPKKFQKYFWEVDAEKLDCKKHPEYVASRILEYGDFEANSWLLKNVEKRIIKNILLKRRGLSARTRSFWSVLFNIPKGLWLEKFYPKRQRALWPY